MSPPPPRAGARALAHTPSPSSPEGVYTYTHMAVGDGRGREGGRGHGLEAKQLRSARKPSKSPAPQVGRRRSERTGHSKTAAKTDAVNRPQTSANNPRPHFPIEASGGGVAGGGRAGVYFSNILSAAGGRPSSSNIAERASEREVEGNTGKGRTQQSLHGTRHDDGATGWSAGWEGGERARGPREGKNGTQFAVPLSIRDGGGGGAGGSRCAGDELPQGLRQRVGE